MGERVVENDHKTSQGSTGTRVMSTRKERMRERERAWLASASRLSRINPSSSSISFPFGKREKPGLVRRKMLEFVVFCMLGSRNPSASQFFLNLTLPDFVHDCVGLPSADAWQYGLIGRNEGFGQTCQTCQNDRFCFSRWRTAAWRLCRKWGSAGSVPHACCACEQLPWEGG